MFQHVALTEGLSIVARDKGGDVAPLPVAARGQNRALVQAGEQRPLETADHRPEVLALRPRFAAIFRPEAPCGGVPPVTKEAQHLAWPSLDDSHFVAEVFRRLREPRNRLPRFAAVLRAPDLRETISTAGRRECGINREQRAIGERDGIRHVIAAAFIRRVESLPRLPA